MSKAEHPDARVAMFTGYAGEGSEPRDARCAALRLSVPQTTPAGLPAKNNPIPHHEDHT